MSVYVDDMEAQFGRMKMCHMIADTEDELHAMAHKIGVARKWYQGDHYDICKSKREIAIKQGALELSRMELGRIVINQRRAARELKPCPLCGCPAMLVGGGKCSTGDIPRGVECSSKLCGVNIPRRFISREAVIEMWNRRLEP